MLILLRLISLSFILLLVGGCAQFGPSVVREERNSYNDALHDTSTEQLLINLVRAKYNEAPTFTNFVEVDSQPSASANIAGGSSNIGAILPFGGLTSTLSTSETAIQKHVSVIGAELIAQISRPITLGNIYRLLNSNEPTIPLLEMSINFIGRGETDYDVIANSIDLLDLYGAIQIESRTDNTLNINFSKTDFIQKGIEGIAGDTNLKCIRANPSKAVDILSKQLADALGQPNRSNLILRTPEAQIGGKNDNELTIAAKSNLPGVTVLTRSAFAVLRLAETETPFLFTDRDTAKFVRDINSNSECHGDQFYFYPKKENIQELWSDYYNIWFQGLHSNDLKDRLRELGNREVYIIIEVSAERPADAYVSVYRRGMWYSINNTDSISKNNFALLNFILTIQAVPTAPPTPTTINAGR